MSHEPTNGEYAILACQQFMGFMPLYTNFTFEDFVEFTKTNHAEWIEDLTTPDETDAHKMIYPDSPQEEQDAFMERVQEGLLFEFMKDDEKLREKYIAEFLRKAWDIVTSTYNASEEVSQ
ncbi:MAG: hypothetical protein ABJN62_09685 [Halioglobus sp.]